MMTFQQATAVAQVDGELTASLSEDWGYWGPLGGYVAGIALRAVGKVVPLGHRPVTMSCQYLSRADFGAISAVTEIVKPGAATSVNVALVQNGRRFFQAQVWTTGRDQGPSRTDARAPDVPAPAQVLSLEHHLERLGDEWPAFWSNFDVRQPLHVGPGECDPRGARAEQWLRFRGFEGGDDVFLDAARLVMIIDMLPWVSFQRASPEAKPYVAPSLDLTVWFHGAALGQEWLLADAHADIADRGLIHGGARVWTEAGALVATGGSQLLVVPVRTDPAPPS